jgi:hypothetical protein
MTANVTGDAAISRETPAPRVSFVIPHKGREELLEQTLKGIDALEGDFERDVILVTQNPTLSATILAAVGGTALQVIHADEALTISELRNLGAANTQGEFLAFLDADIALAPNWLSTLLPMLIADDAIALVSAMQVNGPNPPPLEQIRTALSNATLDAEVAFLPGRNLLLRRSTFEAVGGFPEHLVTCEDYYFTDQVAKRGKLWYSSKTSYVHLGEDKELAGMFRKEIWRGQSNLQSLAGRRVEPGEWPSFVVPPWITIWLITALFAGLLGHIELAVIASALGLAPLAAYVTRLYFLADRRISLTHIVAFYSYYFPARAWGTVLGAFRSLGRDLHSH